MKTLFNYLIKVLRSMSIFNVHQFFWGNFQKINLKNESEETD